jgi:hypothetical protein
MPPWGVGALCTPAFARRGRHPGPLLFALSVCSAPQAPYCFVLNSLIAGRCSA